jgi:hypothetical protein
MLRMCWAWCSRSSVWGNSLWKNTTLGRGVCLGMLYEPYTSLRLSQCFSPSPTDCRTSTPRDPRNRILPTAGPCPRTQAVLCARRRRNHPQGGLLHCYTLGQAQAQALPTPDQAVTSPWPYRNLPARRAPCSTVEQLGRSLAAFVRWTARGTLRSGSMRTLRIRTSNACSRCRFA